LSSVSGTPYGILVAITRPDGGTPPSGETITVDKWLRPLSEPSETQSFIYEMLAVPIVPYQEHAPPAPGIRALDWFVRWPEPDRSAAFTVEGGSSSPLLPLKSPPPIPVLPQLVFLQPDYVPGAPAMIGY
jgi:hypothetical protein